MQRRLSAAKTPDPLTRGSAAEPGCARALPQTLLIGFRSAITMIVTPPKLWPCIRRLLWLRPVCSKVVIRVWLFWVSLSLVVKGIVCEMAKRVRVEWDAKVFLVHSLSRLLFTAITKSLYGCYAATTRVYSAVTWMHCGEFSLTLALYVVCTDRCNSNQFHCSRGTTCISAGRECDGVTHCDDTSDEAKCCKLYFTQVGSFWLALR